MDGEQSTQTETERTCLTRCGSYSNVRPTPCSLAHSDMDNHLRVTAWEMGLSVRLAQGCLDGQARTAHVIPTLEPSPKKTPGVNKENFDSGYAVGASNVISWRLRVQILCSTRRPTLDAKNSLQNKLTSHATLPPRGTTPRPRAEKNSSGKARHPVHVQTLTKLSRRGPDTQATFKTLENLPDAPATFKTLETMPQRGPHTKTRSSTRNSAPKRRQQPDR